MTEPRQGLQQAAEALGLELDLTVIEQLLRYLALLQKWNQVYNLTAVREVTAMLSHHFYDCMAVVPAVRKQLNLSNGFPAGTSSVGVLDVGSGAGLPGIVLAICEPRLQVCCVDAVAKKVAFLRQVKAELELHNAQAIHGRVEQLSAQQPNVRYPLITARAFSSLTDLVEMTADLLAPDGVWMAMKARDVEQELVDLPSTVEMFHVEQLEVPSLSAARCLVWMRQRR